jgi:hypothetical protein
MGLQCLGWRGLCIEPQAHYHASIVANRGCKLVPQCVLGKAARVNSVGQNGDMSVSAASSGQGDISCLGIKSVLDAFNFTHVDFLTIDIEASEPSVMRCFPYQRLAPTAILIETNKHEVKHVDLFFHRHGYSNVETFLNTETWLDNLYIKKRTVLPYPPTHNFTCSPEQRAFNPWCAPWYDWTAENSAWGACMSDL